VKAVTVVGIGDNGCAGLTARAANAVAAAQVLVGGERHLAFFPAHPAEQVIIKANLRNLVARLREERRRVVVLASGDPNCYGIGPLLVEQLGKRFDLVLAMHPAGSRRGELIRRETTVWAGSRVHAAHERDPLPLALAPQGCLFREWSMAALDKAGRRWQLAYMSTSLGACEAAAAAGLAVTVVKASMMPASLRALTAQDGLPKLPAADIALHRAPRLRAAQAAARLGDFIVEQLRDGSI